jgi:putative intracellular protease/amidase
MSPQRLIGMLLFPRLTQFDLTGPFEVFARLSNAQVHLVAGTLEPVTTDRWLAIVPTITFGECPPFDVVKVPGGAGQQDLMEDEVVLAFLRRQAQEAQYVTNRCGAAGARGATEQRARPAGSARRTKARRIAGRLSGTTRRPRGVGRHRCPSRRRDGPTFVQTTASATLRSARP